MSEEEQCSERDPAVAQAGRSGSRYTASFGELTLWFYGHGKKLQCINYKIITLDVGIYDCEDNPGRVPRLCPKPGESRDILTALEVYTLEKSYV